MAIYEDLSQEGIMLCVIEFRFQHPTLSRVKNTIFFECIRKDKMASFRVFLPDVHESYLTIYYP